MPYDNLIKKYGITRQELDKGIDTVAKNIAKICNVSVMLAVTDLLATGDIKEDKTNG